MVDFQSRDTSRGFGDDDDEEEGDAAEDESAAEPAAETESEDAEQADQRASDGEDPVDAADEAAEQDGTTEPARAGDTTESASEDDAGEDEPAEDPLAGSSEGAADDPLAPDTDGTGTDSSGTDPLSPSTEPAHSSEGADGPDDHPFADDEAGAETTGGTDTIGPPEHTPGGTDREATADSDSEAHTDDSAGHAHDSAGHTGHSDDHSHGTDDHSHDHAHGAAVDLLGVAVVTVSSTRTREDDASGDVIQALVEDADHEVVTREILRDDLDSVQTALLNLTGRDDVDVVVTTGGTGVTPDDVTVEAARPLFDRELPGFGELFRILSYEEIGTRAMVSRATAGMVDGVPVFCLPGSEAAARLGTEELVVEEMAHLVSLARRDD